ncbi:MAG: sulfatase-like hydrolase/transferase [Planctomycetota bacterium]
MPEPAVTPERPNLLLITTDQQRWDGMRLNRPEVPLRTTNMDWLASSGTNFTRAYTTCPVCVPARRTLLTGLHPTTHGLTCYAEREWDPPFTVPGLLRDAGYQTQLIGKLHQYPQRKRFGFEHMVRSESPNHRPTSPTQPVNDYTDWLLKRDPGIQPNNHGINGNSRIGRPFNLDENLHHSSWLADEAIDFLTQKRDPSCPWFLHLSFWAPHPPLIPPQAYWDFYKDTEHEPVIAGWAKAIGGGAIGQPPDARLGDFDREELRRAVAGYYGLIHHIDDRIRAVLERYFEYGNPRKNEPVLIVFTSDHGEMLGDHHLFRKSLPYEASAHVPFFVHGYNMGLPGGITSDALVSLEDVGVTLLDAAGVALPGALDGPNEGKSLMPIVRGEGGTTREVLFGQIEAGGCSHHYVVKGPMKYVRFQHTGEEQLFDVLSDPDDTTDLSGDAERLGAMRTVLDAQLQATGQVVRDAGELEPCAGRCPRQLMTG